ncbi:STAS domain-containing protein [Mycobacterium sp. CVI_P3]|uniref:STAS domain-containing protein n=1 Tax=Mycobacterium pinniadriaticum TaxID=2994102 RepID=A0ABT3SGP0_9MYCO|nr:STAS domain-containing protein [Mycobacterium pinniadriaticum]MCX2932123.1 STAS domain-containing protein [Mycobacterium pinniadriaticum]MCX2938547.1 STAS domain-containing protein [Mycobacterium pinniadriaticum]
MPKIVNRDDDSRNRLHLFAEWRSTTEVRITAAGHVDMSTAQQFSEYVLRRAGNCKSLILDMTQVTFFDCAGFSALRYIDERCRMAKVTWTIQPAPTVSRVMALCDPLNGPPMSTGTDFESACA